MIRILKLLERDLVATIPRAGTGGAATAPRAVSDARARPWSGCESSAERGQVVFLRTGFEQHVDVRVE